MTMPKCPLFKQAKCLNLKCLQLLSASKSYLPSMEKLTREEQLSVLVLEKMNTGRTSIPCDWVIDGRGAVVLPCDWAIDSGRGFALGFDWSRRSGSLSRRCRVSLQTDKSRCQRSTPITFIPLCVTGKHVHTVQCLDSVQEAEYEGTTAVMQQVTNTAIRQCPLKRFIRLFEKWPITVFWSSSVWLKL